MVNRLKELSLCFGSCCMQAMQDLFSGAWFFLTMTSVMLPLHAGSSLLLLLQFWKLFLPMDIQKRQAISISIATISIQNPPQHLFLVCTIHNEDKTINIQSDSDQECKELSLRLKPRFRYVTSLRQVKTFTKTFSRP